MGQHQLKEQLQEKFLAEHEQSIKDEISKLTVTAAQYGEVYGFEGKRTDAQKVVMQDMANNGYDDRPLLGISPAGTVDPLVMAHNDGKRACYILVKRMLRMAQDPKELESFVRNKFKPQKG